MTKDIFAKGVSKAIPVLGAAISGGLTYVTYKPMAEKLKRYLETWEIADVDFYKEMQTEDIIDIEVTEA